MKRLIYLLWEMTFLRSNFYNLLQKKIKTTFHLTWQRPAFPLVVLIVLLVICNTPCLGEIENGSFETGNLTGWEVTSNYQLFQTTYGYDIGTDLDHNAYGFIFVGEGSYPQFTTDGTFDCVITAAYTCASWLPNPNPLPYVEMSQTFEAERGDTLSFDYYVQGYEGVSSGTVSATLDSTSLFTFNTGTEEYKNLRVKITSTGNHTLNIKASAGASPGCGNDYFASVHIDNVKLNPKLYGVFVGSNHIMSNGGKSMGGEDATDIQNKFSAFGNYGWSIPCIFDHLKLGDTSRTTVATAISGVEQIIKKDDIMVFFFAGHGGGGLGLDETLVLNGTGIERTISDDQLTAMFSGSAWSGVNKIFILDSCHSGGFGGGEDDTPLESDLMSLPRSAILAACSETGTTGAHLVTGHGKLSDNLRRALTLNPWGYAAADIDGNGLSFDELAAFCQASNEPYDGYIRLDPGNDDVPLESFVPSLFSWSSNDFQLSIKTQPADLNKDGFIDILDFSYFANHWHESGCTEQNQFCQGADICPDPDNVVDIKDLVRLADLWLDGKAASYYCGDGCCDPGEEEWCRDCGAQPFCGDGICDPGEEGWCPDCDFVWVSINDPGVSGREPFNGYMSKYETTNAEYCQYLNAAYASGDVTVSGDPDFGDYVVGTSGPYSGRNYYFLDGPGWTYNGATNGGTARINWTGSTFTVDSGFENHPVTWVTWYGATAFASYYGWRLPTEWEWQAVADFDGSYIWACGTTVNNSIANYEDSVHPDGTTVVGAFGTYGYGVCDMTGNVSEWTDSCYDSDSFILRGGAWPTVVYSCTVSIQSFFPGDLGYEGLGFRVCR